MKVTRLNLITCRFFYFLFQCTDAVVYTSYIVLSFSSMYSKLCGCVHKMCAKMWKDRLYQSVSNEIMDTDDDVSEDEDKKIENENKEGCRCMHVKRASVVSLV